MALDFEGVAAAALRAYDTLLPQWIGGKRVGHEWVAERRTNGGPGDSWSINIKTGVWSHFATGATGHDIIGFYAQLNGLQQGEACRQIAQQLGLIAEIPESSANESPSALEESASDLPEPIPENAPAIRANFGKPSAIYRYGNSLIVMRFDTTEGKTFRQWTWRRGAWTPRGYGLNCPLYRLAELQAAPEAPVLVVEGEKAANAATSTLPDFAVTTWAGGAGAVKKADWTALKGRDVLIWPDADEPGRKAAAEIAQRLHKIARRVRVINPNGADPAWDVADAVAAGWDAGRIQQWIDEHITSTSNSIDPAAKRITRAQPQQARGVTTNAKGNIEDDGSPYVWWDRLALQKTATQIPYTNVVNITSILRRHPEFAGKIWLDSFHRRIFFKPNGNGHREWTDGDDIRALIWIQQQLNMPKLTIDPVRHAVQAVAESNIRNEPQEWLQSLEWDGVDRLAHLMSDGFGTEFNDYTAAVGRCWLTGLVARIFQPGAKVDALPVFEGKEELGKSSALALIGAPWFAECHESITTKDFYQSIQGKALVEISELHAFRKADIDRLKGVISCQIDRYRESYGRRAEDHPRTCVFAGTTNRDNWNASDTGARRFWPIRCTSIDLDWLSESKNALFAEAVARFQRGEIWWNVPRIEARAEQESRRDRDAWEELIEKFITHTRSQDPQTRNLWYKREVPLEEMTVSQILTEALRIEEGRWSRGDQMRVASALQALKWERKRRSDGWKYVKIREV